MIYEIRTYGIAVGSLAEVEKRFGEAYEHRKKYSELAAFWHTEIGPLNEIIHVWPYRDLAERARVRAEARTEPNWPPKTAEFVRSQHSEILVPFPFSPQLTPGKLGPIIVDTPNATEYHFNAGADFPLKNKWKRFTIFVDGRFLWTGGKATIMTD